MGKRRPFVAEDHVRADWDAEFLIEELERRARGYTGLLREVLCTAADILRDQRKQVDVLVDDIRVQGELAEDPRDII